MRGVALAVGAVYLGLLVGVAHAASRWDPVIPIDRVRPSVMLPAPSSDRVKVKVTLTRLECLAESTWDRFSDSDEPCLIVTGFRHPGADTGNSGYCIYSDVDSGEQRAITGNIAKAVPPASGYIMRGTPGGVITAHAAGVDTSYAELGPGEMVGFDVRILEHDDANETTLTGAVADITSDMAATLHSAPSVLGDVLGFIGDITNGIAQLIDALADAILGAGDDYVGGRTVVIYRPETIFSGAPQGPEVPAGADLINIDELSPGVHEKFFFVDGGSEGLYAIVYEVTKTVEQAATPTTVQGVPTQPSGGAPTGPLTVLGQSVPQTGSATVRQVPPATSSTTSAMMMEGGSQSSPRPVVSLAGARADTIVADDFAGDYRLYLDGVPYRLQLAASRAGKVAGYVADMDGRRFNVKDFSAKEHNCRFTIAGLAGRNGESLVLNGFLLTHTKAEIVGMFQTGGRSYGFRASKYKPEADMTRSGTLPR